MDNYNFVKNFIPFKLSQDKIDEINNLKYNEPKRINLTGKIYNRLIVLFRGPDAISPCGKNTTQWWCICSCEQHNIILVRGNNLTSNNTKSCGCKNTESRKQNIKKACVSNRSDISNQIFGELKAIEPTENRKNGSIVWKCICSCGREHYVPATSLKAGKVMSCGHIQESRGVRKIKYLLDSNNIKYTTEKTYISCKFLDTKSSARFDFYIESDTPFLLEFDGEQHFIERNKNFFKDSLEDRQKRDKFKNDWCKNQGIILKRIPYTVIDFLTIEDILGDKYKIS